MKRRSNALLRFQVDVLRGEVTDLNLERYLVMDLRQTGRDDDVPSIPKVLATLHQPESVLIGGDGDKLLRARLNRDTLTQLKLDSERLPTSLGLFSSCRIGLAILRRIMGTLSSVGKRTNRFSRYMPLMCWSMNVHPSSTSAPRFLTTTNGARVVYDPRVTDKCAMPSKCIGWLDALVKLITSLLDAI